MSGEGLVVALAFIAFISITLISYKVWRADQELRAIAEECRICQEITNIRLKSILEEKGHKEEPFTPPKLDTPYQIARFNSEGGFKPGNN